MIPPLLFALILATSTSPPVEERTYHFSDKAEFSDFEIIAGRWGVSAGSLSCSSKGQQDELRWRRSLTLPASIHVQLETKGRFTLRTTSSTSACEVEFHRAKGTFQVRQGDRVLLDGYYLAPRSGPLDLRVKLIGAQVSVQVGDDKDHAVSLTEPVIGSIRLSLLSHRSQSRLHSLAITRADPPVEEGQPQPNRAQDEDDSLRLQDARALGEQGRWRDAWETLLPLLPERGAWEDLPAPLLRLLNRIAVEEPRVRSRPPLEAWLESNRVQSRDGTVSAQRPLDATWTTEVPLARRVDGMLLVLECRVKGVRVEVHRYDHRVRYWFGEEPRTHFVQGSSATGLARARAADMVVEKPEARLLVEPRRSAQELGDQTTTEYVVRHLTKKENGKPVEYREYHVVHRGNAHRLTIEGPPKALESLDAELRWILATFTFHSP